MMEGDPQKIAAAVEKAGEVAILLLDEAEETDLLAAYALKEKFGAKAHILNMPPHAKERWGFLFSEHTEAKREVVISLNTAEYPIDELRYEKNGSTLSIYLAAARPPKRDAFSFEERYTPCDMIIAVGFRNEDALQEKIKEIPLKAGGAVFFVAGHASMQASMDTVGSPASLPPQQPAPLPFGQAQLWARALLRSSFEKEQKICWSFITPDDFIKTGETRRALPALFQHVRRTLEVPTFILLWQETKETAVYVSLHTTHPPISQRLLHVLAAQFPSFTEAETEIRKLLK